SELAPISRNGSSGSGVPPVLGMASPTRWLMRPRMVRYLDDVFGDVFMGAGIMCTTLWPVLSGVVTVSGSEGSYKMLYKIKYVCLKNIFVYHSGPKIGSGCVCKGCVVEVDGAYQARVDECPGFVGRQVH